MKKEILFFGLILILFLPFISAFICPDINNDGIVNYLDQSIIADSFNKCSGEEGYLESADLNADGCIYNEDLYYLQNSDNWLKTRNEIPGCLKLSNVWDVDDNGIVDANVDGKIILKYFYEVNGDALLSEGVGNNAQRTTATEIENYLDSIKSQGALDVDGNNQNDGGTDGALIYRYIVGYTGEDLINEAVASDATRDSVDEIHEFLECENNICLESSVGECVDSDGNNLFQKGYVNYRGKIYNDVCYGGGLQIGEMICVGSGMSNSVQDCPEGFTCKDGACVNLNSNVCGTYSYQTPIDAKASSEFSSGYSAKKAIDGKTYSYWFTKRNEKNKWIYLDLGKEKCINGIKLNFHKSYVPITFNIDISNDAVNWESVKKDLQNKGGGQFVEFNFDEVNARYIRIYETEISSGSRNYGTLTEVEVRVADYNSGTKITCYNNSDCGGLVLGDFFCNSSNVYRKDTINTCINPGTENSYCSSDYSYKLIEKCLDSCEKGICVNIVKENKKLMKKYSNREVFLISDKNWKDVLPLVPLTTWTKQEGDNSNCQKGTGTPDDVCVYPTLIYHDETGLDKGFDVDSIIYFMQQYKTQKITIIGDTTKELDNLLIAPPDLGVGLKSNQINKTSVADYLSYWESFKDVVYVEDDYELALLASTYASLINAPLIIQGTDLDKENVFVERDIICVGNVNKNCNEKYNLEQLQKKYIEETNTDKIILVNPNDLNFEIIRGQLKPKKSANLINEIYSKTSLASPILASAKHELIISKKNEDVGIPVNCDNFNFRLNSIENYDNFVENKINLLNNKNYLTIFACPNAIPQSFNYNCDPLSHWGYILKQSVDNVYATSGNYVLNQEDFEVAIDKRGIIHMVENTLVNHMPSLNYRNYNLSSGKYSEPSRLSKDKSFYNPKITFDAGNNVHIIFEGKSIYNKSHGLYYFKLNSNGNLIDSIKLSSDSYISAFKLKVDEQDNLHVIWSSEGVSGYDLHYAKLNNGQIIINNNLCEVNFLYLNQIAIYFDKEGKTNIFRIKDYKIYKLKLGSKGEIEEQGYFVGNPLNYKVSNFQVSTDLDRNLVIFSILSPSSWAYPYNVYYLYSKNTIKLFNTSIMGGEFRCGEIQVDENDYLHFLINTRKNFFNKCSVYTSSYGKMNLDGNLIVEDESILSEPYAIKNPKLELYLNLPLVFFRLFNYTSTNCDYNDYPYSDSKFYTFKEEDTWADFEKIDVLEFSEDYDLRFGRIYGLTLSDTSSYVARALFDNKIEYKKDTGISIADSFSYARESVSRVAEKMISFGYNWSCFTDEGNSPCKKYPFKQIYLKDKYIINYIGHGSSSGMLTGLTFSDLPLMKQSFLIGDACSTNDFEAGRAYTFGPWVLRKGGSGYIGCSGASFASIKEINNVKYLPADILTDKIINKKVSIGELFHNLSNEFEVVKEQYLLYGDPTFEVGLK